MMPDADKAEVLWKIGQNLGAPKTPQAIGGGEMRRAPQFRRRTRRDAFLERRKWIIEGLKQGTVDPDAARRSAISLAQEAKKLRRRGEL